MKINCFPRQLALITLALGGTLHFAQTVALADAVRAVALSAQQVPGAPAGVSYASFLPPTLNEAGKVAFVANVAGSSVDFTNGQGIWSEGSGSLATVARGGNLAPGTSGVQFRGFSGRRLGLSTTGKTSFFSFLAATQSDEQGIWSESTGGLALVARQGNPAVGMPAGVVYSEISPDSVVVNNAGLTAFTSDMTQNGFPYGAGLWSGTAGNLRVVARSGTAAPGTGSGVNLNTFTSPVLNDLGRTAFISALDLSGNGVKYGVNEVGIWSEGSGTLALVARAGSPAPGTPSGVTFGSAFFPPALNNPGQTVFAAYLTGSGVDDSNGSGLWSKDSGSLRLVARAGSHAAGTPSGVNYGTFYTAIPVINNAGQIAFGVKLTGSGVDPTNDGGFWEGTADNLALVVRSGSHAPGTPAGVNFASLGYAPPSLNDAGQIAFAAPLTGIGVDDTNGAGFWATDVRGDLQLIARDGDLLEVAPGDFRTIDELSAIGVSGNSDGLPSAFNDLGQLAFRATFTDGTEGVFVSDRVAVPEPQSLALLGLAVPMFLRRRRNRGCMKTSITDALKEGI